MEKKLELAVLDCVVSGALVKKKNVDDDEEDGNCPASEVDETIATE